ncbi:MAG: acyl--CoA ligase [Ruminococcus sp.]|nr:acyl--CoA ligase [Ruminococcus sp.]
MSEEKKLTGYPSIDKPWLKYYSADAINAKLPECTIYKYLWDNNKDYLDNIALNYFDRKITYGEMFVNIKKAAKAFYALGVRAGDIVVMTTVTTPETIYAFYGLNRLGAISNMVDPRTSEEGIRDYIKEVNAKFVLTIDVALPKIRTAIKGTKVEKVLVVSPADSLPQPKKALFLLSNKLKGETPKLFKRCICWDDFIEQGRNKKPVFSRYKKDTCCVIVHTGGTTGTPKGVMLSNENLNASAIQCHLSGFDFRRKHKWLGVMPPFIAYGIGNGLHLPLVIGMTLILLPKFDPEKYDLLLKKYTPNHIAGVPSHYNTIMHSKVLKNSDLSFLLSPIVGGDGTEERFERQISRYLTAHNCQSNLTKGYGMTEVCAAVCATAMKETNKIGSVGIPFTHSVVSVFEPHTDNELKYGEIGEICMLTPNTMIGYYNNQAETNAILQKHSDGFMWIHSDDLGYLDSDGCIFIKDRIKRMIIRHDGFKVYPSQIEKTITQSRIIASCCVVGVEDYEHSQGKLPIAFVVLNEKADKRTAKTELHDLCKRELPEYAQPVDFVFIDEMPLTPIGKVDYRALEKMAEGELK